MKIEDEIHSSFINEYHKALVNLIYTHNYIVDRMNERFKEHDITRQQFNVLRILKGQYPNPVPVTLIKDRMLDKMSDASRIVDRLIKKGLIEKAISPKDRRAVDVSITKEGMSFLKRFEPISNEFNDFLTGLGPEEASKLNELLDKIRNYKN